MGNIPSLCNDINVNVEDFRRDIERHERLIADLQRDISGLLREENKTNQEILDKITDLRIVNTKIVTDIDNIRNIILQYTSSVDLKEIMRKDLNCQK